LGITGVEVSGRLALACRGCGEIILFLGRERDWYEPSADGRPRSFVCSGCGTHLTLANRVVGAGARSSLWER
jgi:DNA-directed RNA polymerase subunit RPC12/RpoP